MIGSMITAATVSGSSNSIVRSRSAAHLPSVGVEVRDLRVAVGVRRRDVQEAGRQWLVAVAA
jgi:hypothetical protein